MRTTIEIPDIIFREIKVLAVNRGVTLKALVLGAVERELGESRQRRFPLISSKAPGTLTLTNAEIEDLLT